MSSTSSPRIVSASTTEPKQLEQLPDILHPKDIVELTGISETTVRRYIHRGIIPGAKVGKFLLTPKQAFMEWLGA